EGAGNVPEAIKWHRRAAEWSGLNDQDEAMRHWSAVRELLDTLPGTSENIRERAVVRAQILNQLARIGDTEGQATTLFRDGGDLAARTGDPAVVAQVVYGYGILRHWAGSSTEAYDVLLEAARRADETEDVGLKVAVRYGLSLCRFVSGRLSESLASIDEGLRLTGGDPRLGADHAGASPLLLLSAARGLVLPWVGDPGGSATELNRLIELARSPAQPLFLYAGNAFQVFRCALTGELDAALVHGRRGLEYVERIGSQVGRAIALTSWGLANVLNGHWVDSLEPLNQALAIARTRGLRAWEGLTVTTMADAHLGLGEYEEGRVLANDAIATSRSLGTRLWEGPAQLARVHALRKLDLGENEIEAALAEMTAWVKTSGAKGWAPFLHVERAELARIRGDGTTREHEIRQAHRLFTEIGAPLRAEKLARELPR
ncbi:MAG: hypothetical protein ACREQ9_15515, partial [Candidatus Binatia bacterium]